MRENDAAFRAESSRLRATSRVVHGEGSPGALEPSVSSASRGERWYSAIDGPVEGERRRVVCASAPPTLAYLIELPPDSLRSTVTHQDGGAAPVTVPSTKRIGDLLSDSDTLVLWGHFRSSSFLVLYPLSELCLNAR